MSQPNTTETVHIATDELFPAYDVTTPDQGHPIETDSTTADRWRRTIHAYTETCAEITAALTTTHSHKRHAA